MEAKFSLRGTTTETRTVQTAVTATELFQVLGDALIRHLNIQGELLGYRRNLGEETNIFYINEEGKWVVSTTQPSRYAQPPTNRVLRAATKHEKDVWEAFRLLRTTMLGPAVGAKK